jgi:glyoxylase-like metal-dependent hydrolase (beta-lactamase superfamily II)
MIFRQLFDTESSTYTYLLGDESTGEALLIDPVKEKVERDLTLVAELGLRLVYVLETHVHADHVTAAGILRERTGARTVWGARGARCADLHVGGGGELRVGGLVIRVLDTPGHTDDSVSYLAGDRGLHRRRAHRARRRTDRLPERRSTPALTARSPAPSSRCPTRRWSTPATIIAATR